jgi:hypothetical protein
MADDVLARYPIRTPPGYRVVLALIVLLGAGAVVTLIWAWSIPHAGSSIMMFLLGFMATMPVWYFLSTKPYRIAGGKGEIAMYADRIEVVTGAGSLVFPASTILIGATPQVVQYRAFGVIPLGERRVGTLVVLASASQRFLFSSKLFADDEWLPGFLDDVTRVHTGQPPLGPRVPERPKPAKPSTPDGYDYEAELDRELRNVD